MEVFPFLCCIIKIKIQIRTKESYNHHFGELKSNITTHNFFFFKFWIYNVSEDYIQIIDIKILKVNKVDDLLKQTKKLQLF